MNENKSWMEEKKLSMLRLSNRSMKYKEKLSSFGLSPT